MYRAFFVVMVQIIIVEGCTMIKKENLTCNIHNLPCLDQNEWWGPYEMKDHEDTRIRPFRIKFDDVMIQDLRFRLRYHRPFTPPLEGISFEYGFNTKVLHSWVRYWAEEYPFKEREEFLNQYPMYETNIQGLDIFFIWVKPRNVSRKKFVVPLLLLHGWPGSVREFYEVIPMLTAEENNRDFALELIIPSLPGFGYSDSAVRPGLGAAQIGVVFHNLMHRLGFNQYYVQGGDLGGIIGSYMATMYPKQILGFHTNWPFLFHPTATLMQVLGAIYPPLVVDPALAYRMYPLFNVFSFLVRETGYLHEQATKPDTVGVGLTDSPSGLLAYNLEKFNSFLGTRCTDDLDNLPKVDLIDNLMMYWVPKAITTAMRFYAETVNLRHLSLGLDIIPAQVLVWTIQAENEASYISPPLLKVKYPFLVNDTAINIGGHFLAFETPKIFANDVLTAIAAFRRFRTRQGVIKVSRLQPEYQWTLNGAELLQVIFNLQKHPEAWWVRGVLKFLGEALLRLAKRILSFNHIALMISQMIS